MSDGGARRLARLARLRALAERVATRRVAAIEVERAAAARLAARLGEIIDDDRRAARETSGAALAATAAASGRARALRDAALARLAAIERQLSDATRAMLLARGGREAVEHLIGQRRDAAHKALERRAGERAGGVARGLHRVGRGDGAHMETTA